VSRPGDSGATAPWPIVADRDRHLKWRAFDPLELVLMLGCGACLMGFSATVVLDITTRTLQRPWLWLQEVTSALFVYGAFFGLAVATRRADHLMLSAITESMHGALRLVVEVFNRLVILACGVCLVWFGVQNFRHGFGSFRMPSLTPLAWWYLAIPVAGVFVCLFVIEQLVNGIRSGFEPPPARKEPPAAGRRPA
jgi:TRAP-type C4-dicarboxylate transport system permease small subunit